MKRIWLAVILSLCATAAYARTWRVGIVEVLDGDTFLSDREVFGKRQKIRLLGVDTPEISKAMCDKERAAGIAARNYLQAQLAASDNKVTLRRVKEDKFGGRWDAQVWLTINGKSIDATALIVTNGYGKPYQGKARDPMQWCKDAG